MTAVQNSELMIAVWMVAYNHEPFISQAIESVLSQNTTFRFKLFIGEDCSTDNTRSICLSYREQYPDKIELILQPENTGGYRNAMDVYQSCFKSGAKYLALLEGDDYWTDPCKLQKQIDFLEANSDFAICCHKVTEIDTVQGYPNREFPKISEDKVYTLDDYILSNHTGTSSIVFKAKYFSNEPWFIKSPFGDIALVLIVMKNSTEKLMVLNKAMSVYRLNSQSVHGFLRASNQGLINAYKQHLTFTELIESEFLFEKRFRKSILKNKRNTHFLLAGLYKKESSYLFYFVNKFLGWYYNLVIERA